MGDHKWKVILLLSVIIPMSFLVTFILAGLMGGPATVAETLTLDMVRWERERPCLLGTVPGPPTIEADFSNDEVAMTEILWVSYYDPDWFGQGPASYIGITNLSVSVQQGFVDSLNINFGENYAGSYATFYNQETDPPNSTIVLSNLMMDRIIDHNKTPEFLRNGSKAFLYVKGVGRPTQVFIGNGALLYRFRSPHNFTHTIDISSEIVYFNGTVYKRLIMPIQFIFEADNNNSFETAEEIEPDEQDRQFFLGGDDDLDFYKVYLRDDETLNITIANEGQGFNMYLFSPCDTAIPVAGPANGVDKPESITYKADYAGWWFIKVEIYSGSGTYSVLLETFPAGGS